MVDKQVLFSIVDQLPPDDLEQLYQHIKQRRQVAMVHMTTGSYPAVPDLSQREAADTIREEVNAVIDAALNVVRRKRETQEQAKLKS